MQYIKLLKTLYEENIRYLLCGGLAVNIYGIPRMTADIDIIIDFDKQNLIKFEDVLKKLNYQKLISADLFQLFNESYRKELTELKNLIAFSFFNPDAFYMNLDILIKMPYPFEAMWKEKVERKADGFFVYLISLQHLIDMKTHTGREQDKQDILNLSKFLNK
ncbi:MAG: hypothetical protein HY958_11110 [Bacteroidia bacterium]|nr:hypothetical protein [Bacteroidia bacterium]